MSAAITVHLRVNDAAGRPTAVRLAVAGPDGTAYAPLGRSPVFPVGRGEDVGGQLWLDKTAWSVIDGACEIRLPTGVPLRVRAIKGPEWQPLDRTVSLGAGQMALRFEMQRPFDMAADGWVSGDGRAHFLPPHAALLEAAAEDVAVVNLLAVAGHRLAHDGETYPYTPNLLAFSGQTPALERDGRMVVVNTLNTHPTLGRVGLLNCHRTVFPLSFGEPDGPDDWSVTDWCQQCHRKKGLTVWTDAFRPDAGLPGGEALVAAVLGQIDAVEFDARPRPQPFLPWYYRLLNAGLALPLVGASGKESNKTPLGAVRTYARVGEPGGYAGWVEAVRAGRTFVTNGPLLRFEANGSGPGDTIDAGGPVRIRASAESLSPFERVEVVADGQVIGSGATAAEVEHRFAESGWLAARCVGGAGSPLFPGQPAFAHASPVWVRVDGRPLPRRPEAVAALVALIDGVRTWAVEHGVYADEKWKAHLIELCEQAIVRLTAP